MDDESGEQMEPMEEMPRILGESELEWIVLACMVDGEKPGVDSREERKHIGKNLLFVEKMM